MKRLRLLSIYILVLFPCLSAFPALAQQSDLERANALNQQFVELYNQGKYKDAIPLVRELLAINEKTYGPEHPYTADSLNSLALLLANVGDFAQAEPLYRRALAIREKALGPEHPNTAQSLNNLAVLYESMGEYSRAEPLHKRALAIREKVLGPNHPDTAISLYNLAALYSALGDYTQAEPMLKKVLTIWEKALGQEHPRIASTLNHLALLYCRMGEYALAKPPLKRALAIREKALGPKHPDITLNLNNLAGMYFEMGDHTRAEQLYKRALSIQEEVLGPEHPHTASSLSNLGILYLNMGEYALAEPLYKRALAIREKVLGPKHPNTAGALNNLASLYSDMGDYARAEPLFKRVLIICEESLGPEHPHTATSLNNLASLYSDMGDYTRVEPLYKKVLAIREKVLGPKHPYIALGLNSLAALYLNIGDYARAEPLFKKALTILEKALGPEHPHTALCMKNLASLYWNMGEYARAEPLFKKALAIKKKMLGPEHPDTANCLNGMAKLLVSKGDYTSAYELKIKAQKISAKLIDQVMSFTSEDQKLKFLATQEDQLFDALGLVAFHLDEDKNAVREILNIWLGRKGVVLEAQRRYQEALVYSDNPKAAQIFYELAGVRSHLSRLMFGGPGKEGPKGYRKKYEALEAREKELEARLSRLSQAFVRQKRVKRADTGNVARALPQGSVLLDFAQIRPFDYQAKVKEKRRRPVRYLAFVLHAGKGDRVSLVDLGEAAPIDRAVADLKAAIANLSDKSGKKAIVQCEKLYEMVFTKLEKEIGPAKDIFISPDGNLNLIPFEVLRRPDGKYLIEEFSFNYLASGRDIIGFGMFRTESGPPLILGDPDFEATTSGAPETDSFTRSVDMRNLYFDRLPGTLDEVMDVYQILGTGNLYTGKEATEDKLFQTRSPRILHLATHGFFLTDVNLKPVPGAAESRDASPGGRPIRMENPLLRSGLALAGANRALATNEVDRSNGLLTAEKVLSLRLQGTDLVVLSACNTGTGEVKTGEGVYGLRRAFVQAGAKGLVMSMWPVPDKETKELMETFYKHLSIGKMSRSEALRQAALRQMQVTRERYGHTNPLFWCAFVYLGEP